MADRRPPLRLRDRGRRLGRLRARQPAQRRSLAPLCWCWRRAGGTGVLTCTYTCPQPCRSLSAIASTTGSTPPSPSPTWAGAASTTPGARCWAGSSSINGMIFQRGNPLDYERWAADPGMEQLGLRPLPALLQAHGAVPGWRRPQRSARKPRQGRLPGRSGPSRAGAGVRPPTRLFEAFLEATEQAGHRRTSDVNGYRQEGFAAFDRNVHRGRRLSASRAYLHPVLRRPNLDLITRALTTRVLFEGDRATGVAYTKGGRSRTVNAGEVICCGGAINSPQLLQALRRGPGRSPAPPRHRRGGRRSRRGCQHAGPLGGVRAVRLQAAGVDAAQPGQVAPPADRTAVAGPPRAGGDQPLRGGRLRPQQR